LVDFKNARVGFCDQRKCVAGQDHNACKTALLSVACQLSGDELLSPSAKLKLNPAQLPLVQHVDGRWTIKGIVECVAQGGDSTQGSRADLEEFGRNLFQSLWRLDFLAMALNTNPTG
jgi:hypothetical protein